MGKSYLKMERELLIDSSFCVLLLFTTYTKCMYLEPAIFLQLTLTDCEYHASLMKGMNFSSLVEKRDFFLKYFATILTKTHMFSTNNSSITFISFDIIHSYKKYVNTHYRKLYGLHILYFTFMNDGT